jgi:DNA-3-methyladenine glycosylase II
MKLQTVEGKLYPKDPFDFSKSLNFIDMFLPSENEYKIEDLSLIKAIHLDGQTVAFKLESVGTVEKPVLNYEFYGYEVDNKLKTDLVDRINFFLSLGDDLKPFYHYAVNDELFKHVVNEFYGLHQVKFLTPFEAAGWAVLSQRIPMKVANKMKENLTKSVGNKINLDGQDYWAFPSPDQIMNLDLDHIISIVKNKRKSAYLINVAEAFGNVDEEFLRNGTLDEVKSWLLDIKGIGEWSAHLELIRGLGRMEDSLNDRMLGRCVEKIYGSETKPEDIKKISEGYKDFVGYWEYYLRTGC